MVSHGTWVKSIGSSPTRLSSGISTCQFALDGTPDSNTIRPLECCWAPDIVEVAVREVRFALEMHRDFFSFIWRIGLSVVCVYQF